ncbi:MAG: MFS transporter [Rhodovarius sp.]|nr:MFS transporter [Rhodovarius sp.]
MHSPLPAAAPPARLGQVVCFIAAATCAFAGVWMSLPLASVLLAEAGASPALVGLYAASVWAASLASAPLTPWLAGRAGGALHLHRLAAAGGAGVLAALALGPPLWVWFLLGPALGVATCLTWTTADALAGALARPGSEGRFLGLYQTFVSAAIGGGPATLWLWGVRPEAFVGSAALMLVGLAFTAPLQEPPGAVPRRSRLTLPRVKPVALMMLAPAGAAALCGVLESLSGSVFPVMALGLGMSAGAAASIVVATGFGNTLSQYPVGWLADRFGTAPVLLGCAMVVAAGVLVWPALAPDPWIWPVLAVWGGAAGAIYTLGMVRAVQRFAGPARAIGMAGLNTAYLLGGAIGAPVAGVVLERGGDAALTGAVALLALAGGAGLAALSRRARA